MVFNSCGNDVAFGEVIKASPCWGEWDCATRPRRVCGPPGYSWCSCNYLAWAGPPWSCIWETSWSPARPEDWPDLRDCRPDSHGIWFSSEDSIPPSPSRYRRRLSRFRAPCFCPLPFLLLAQWLMSETVLRFGGSRIEWSPVQWSIKWQSNFSPVFSSGIYRFTKAVAR